MPFWPGGLDAAEKESLALKDLDESSKGLRKIPPGFTRGLRLPGDTDEDEDAFDDIVAQNHGAEQVKCTYRYIRVLTCYSCYLNNRIAKLCMIPQMLSSGSRSRALLK